MLETLDKYYTWLLRGMMGAAALYMAAIMVSIVYFTTCRGLGIPYSSYSFIFIEYGFIYVLMLGAPWLVRRRGHVFIEILTATLPDSFRPAYSRFVAALCVAICAVLAWYSGEVAWTDYFHNEIDVRGSIDTPRWIVTVSLPFGFALMAIEFARFVVGTEVMHTGEAGVHE